MEDIRLPLTNGSMDEISEGGEASSQPDSGDTPVDSMSSFGARAIYEREARILVNYEQLNDDYKDVSAHLVVTRYDTVQ